eukprot:TRINITY_DN34817_c0_g1_i1.p1 TRINITY_DN34817_c0_g1~~TRINITY_DN34817_c0_g1_i1.p1  ORF type:complete len:372 (+),score=78.46 TRINITY_DN34817_c0_g1_i1:55-1170(+)
MTGGVEAVERQFGITFRQGIELNGTEDVMTQVLHSDLQRIVARGGVEKLIGIEKGKISEPLFVQVEEYHDVSMSLREAAKLTASGIEKNTKRCLKMVLSDGVNTIPAIEMKRNNALDSLVPGCKLLLNNFEVRLGNILIESNTPIKSLGGQNLELIELNAHSWKHDMLQVVGKEYFMRQNQQQALPSPPPQPSQQEQVKRSRVQPQPPVEQLSLAELFQLKSTSAETPRVLVTRAILVEIVGSFTYHTGQYVLSVLLDDGSARVVCNIEDAVVQKLINLPAPELLRIRHSDDNQFQQIASKFQDMLEQLGPKMFKLKQLESTPVICAINDLTVESTNKMEESVPFLMSRLARSTNPEAAKLAQMLVARGLS